MKYLYKGMAQGAPSAPGTSANADGARARNVTPQGTGFSQIGGRSFGGAEGGGQGMSVLLSWHEKVSSRFLMWDDWFICVGGMMLMWVCALAC